MADHDEPLDRTQAALDANARLWRTWVLEHVGALRGYNLACFCTVPKPGEVDRCHRRVLLKLANPEIAAAVAAFGATIEQADLLLTTCARHENSTQKDIEKTSL